MFIFWENFSAELYPFTNLSHPHSNDIDFPARHCRNVGKYYKKERSPQLIELVETMPCWFNLLGPGLWPCQSLEGHSRVSAMRKAGGVGGGAEVRLSEWRYNSWSVCFWAEYVKLSKPNKDLKQFDESLPALVLFVLQYTEMILDRRASLIKNTPGFGTWRRFRCKVKSVSGLDGLRLSSGYS